MLEFYLVTTVLIFLESFLPGTQPLQCSLLPSGLSNPCKDCVAVVQVWWASSYSRVPRLNWALGAVWAQDEAGCSAIPAGGGEGAWAGLSSWVVGGWAALLSISLEPVGRIPVQGTHLHRGSREPRTWTYMRVGRTLKSDHRLPLATEEWQAASLGREGGRGVCLVGEMGCFLCPCAWKPEGLGEVAGGGAVLAAPLDGAQMALRHLSLRASSFPQSPLSRAPGLCCWPHFAHC